MQRTRYEEGWDEPPPNNDHRKLVLLFGCALGLVFGAVLTFVGGRGTTPAAGPAPASANADEGDAYELSERSWADLPAEPAPAPQPVDPADAKLEELARRSFQNLDIAIEGR